MDEELLRMLEVVTTVSDSSIVLEHCGDYLKELEGYYVTIPKIYLEEIKKKVKENLSSQVCNEEFIDKTFEGSEEVISQTILIAFKGEFLTKILIEKYGDISAVLSSLSKDSKVSIDLTEDMYENGEEEEDEEMIKELQEALELANNKYREIEEKLKSSEDKTVEVEKLNATLSEELNKLKEDSKNKNEIIEGLNSVYDRLKNIGEDITQEDAEEMIDFIMRDLEDEKVKPVLINSVLSIIEDDTEFNDDQIVKFFMCKLRDSLEEELKEVEIENAQKY